VTAAVLDHTAISALRKAHEVLTGFYVEASRGGFTLYVPALSIFGADSHEGGAASFVRGSRSLTTVAFDLDAAETCAGLARAGVDWRAAHAVHVARPSADNSGGWTVLTMQPELYADTGISALHPDG
jgi:hypothetical protein